jgi:chaperonin GroES
MASIRPTGDRLIIKKESGTRVSHGAIVLPEGSRSDSINFGTVIAVGPGRITKKGVRVPPEVRVGDKVAYVFALEKTNSNVQLKESLNDKEFILQEKDVLAVIE